MRPLAVRSSEWLQRQSSWQFDLRSAIIGALAAWIVAGIIYSQRKAIVQLAKSLWAPIAAWRRRIQASQEEKYIRALREALKPLLLLEPPYPEAVTAAPLFQTFAPLPKTIAEAAQSPWTVVVTQQALLEGYPKVVIAGFQGSGRTSSLLLSLQQALALPDSRSPRPYTRLPVWLDLNRLDEVSTDPKTVPLQSLAELATAFLPEVLPKWLVRHLKNEPVLILLDNWETLTDEQRAVTSRWIAAADKAIPDAVWLATAGTIGYGELVEAGFVPAELLPTLSPSDVPRIHEGWCRNLGHFGEEATLTDEAADVFAGAINAGAPLWELHLRIAVYLETGELPARQAEVLDRFVVSRLSRADLGRGSESWTTQALDAAAIVLTRIAAAGRIDDQSISSQSVRDLIEKSLPPKDERPRRLEAAVKKILSESQLLRRDDKHWTISHPLLADYLTARYLAGQETGVEVIERHLEDPTWLVLSEFYAGLTDAGDLARALIQTSQTGGDRDTLLRVARWGIVADPDQPWRKDLIKSLAQAFIEADLPWSTRLSIGNALSHIAGTGARAFFLKVLRHSSIDVRCAALRGLGWSGSENEIPLLAAALRDSSDAVQASAADALRDAGSDEAIAFLRESLPKVNETLMVHIAEALASSPAGQDALLEASQYPDLLVRRAASQGLGLIDTSWAEERLLEMGREDPEWLVRSAAESAIQAREERSELQARVSPPPDVAQMDWLIAWAARQGQGLGVGEAARETLLRAAQEGNVDAKILSALTLGQIGRQADMPLLSVLEREGDPELKRAAAWALSQLQQRYRNYKPA